MKKLKKLAEIVEAFQTSTHFEKIMDDILADIGSYLDVSRIYIFIDDNEDTISNTFEWCDEGIISQKQFLQKINKEKMTSFNEILTRDGWICSNYPKYLPQDIIERLQIQEVLAIAVYPLLNNNERIGFIGFDECRYPRTWQDDELNIFKLIAGLVANAYQSKFAKEELDTLETHLQDLFETTNDLLVITDLAGKIVYGNQVFVNKVGYSLGELLHMDMSNLYPTIKQAENIQLIDNLLNGKCPTGYLEIVDKSGEVFEVNAKASFGMWNKTDCIYITAKDTTKEMESLQLFSTIFARNPLPMAIINLADKTVSKINPQFVHKTGYTEEDILGLEIEDLDIIIHADEKKEIRNKRLNGEEIIAEELSIRRKDDRTMFGLLSIEEIISNGKKSLLMVLVDVTEHVKLRKKLEKSNTKLTNIIDGTRAATWELNLLTDHIQYNDYWTEWLGYSREEMFPITMDRWNELTHPEDLPTAYEKLNKHINGKMEYYESEMRLKHQNGYWVWSHARGRVTERDSKGKPLKMFGTHSDISDRKYVEQKIKESERRLFLALDKTQAGLWDVDLIKQNIFVTPMWKEILGYEDHELENTVECLKELIHPEDRIQIKETGSNFIHGETDTYQAISRFRHKDGSWRWIRIRGGVLNNKDGLPERLIGTNSDITKEHNESLELERFFSVNLDLLSIIDNEGKFTKTNKSWEEVLGYPSALLKGRNFLDFVHPDDIPKTLKVMEDLYRDKKVTQFTNRYIGKDGTYRDVEWRANLYDDTIYAAARDVTNRKEYERKILELSNKDSLTNVYNRRYINNRIQEMLEDYAETHNIFSVALIDIDDFKKINDTYGHQIGDYVLQAFTNKIKENLRPSDLLSRYGGEEFVIVLDGNDAQEAHLVMERILKLIRNTTFIFEEAEITFTFSAGVSTCKEVSDYSQKINQELVNQLIHLADQRMYHAKSLGKNQVISEIIT